MTEEDRSIAILIQSLRTSDLQKEIRSEMVTKKEFNEFRRAFRYYSTRPKVTGLEREPKIVSGHIAKTAKDWVRFCLIQLDYDLRFGPASQEFGYFLRHKNTTKTKIFGALKIAKDYGVDVVVFPELSFAKEWVPKVEQESGRMVVIGGSYYEGGYNVCPIIVNGARIDPPYRKCCPSPFENPRITERGMKSGNILYILQTQCGKFSVLTSSDYTDQSYRICRYIDRDRNRVGLIINPSCDRNIARFQHRCNVDCQDFGIDIIQVNSAPKKGGYGGTCIIGKEHDIILGRLVQEGYKPRDEVKYKFLQLGSEAMIIVDLNIAMKALSVGLPLDYSGRVSIRRDLHFQWDEKNWVSLPG